MAEEGKVALYVRISPSLKRQLEDIAYQRRRNSSARFTVTDLVVEALEKLAAAHESETDKQRRGEQEGKD